MKTATIRALFARERRENRRSGWLAMLAEFARQAVASVRNRWRD